MLKLSIRRTLSMSLAAVEMASAGYEAYRASVETAVDAVGTRVSALLRSRRRRS